MNPELLIYAAFSSPRLDYTLRWIFTEQLQIAYKLTADPDAWDNYTGPKISYQKEAQIDSGIRIIPHKILQEDNITVQELSVNRWKHSTILFYNQPGAAVPFDIFAAVFFLDRSARRGGLVRFNSVAASMADLDADDGTHRPVQAG
ncbi:MAG: hypothetical protein EOO01_28090, partial [Chitinophagaceae bacterium]